MNDMTQPTTCACKTCSGGTCNCGCQAVPSPAATQATCACGPQCPCGPGCNCAKS
ncbi:MAG: hypothetical protein RLY71_59 [Pseudomonadota bacterium]